MKANRILDIMPEIKNISGDKSGRRIYRAFQIRDERNNWSESNALLIRGYKLPNGKGWKGIFKLKIPEDINPAQIYSLQEEFLKWCILGKEILKKKEGQGYIAEVENKILPFSRLISVDMGKENKIKTRGLKYSVV